MLRFVKGYTLFWNQMAINVFRPDVECTNGIIHVIDHPFLVESDIQVTGHAAQLASSAATILVGSLLMTFVAKLIV